MSNLENAQADFDKKDKRLRVGLGIFITYVVLLLSFVAVETLITQTTIRDNQAANAKASEERFKRYTEDNAVQHQKTQQYIRCIAQVLLLPLDQRTDEAFDKCSQDGIYNGKSSGSTSQPTTGSQPAATAPAQPTPQSSQPTPTSEPVAGGSPPDDDADQPDDRSALGKLPLVGGFFNAIGL